MIVSLRKITYEELKAQLSEDDKIVLWSCDTCIKFCGLGGYDRMMQLEKMLKNDGFKVIGKELISISCMLSLVEQHKADPSKKTMFDEATVIITHTCEDANANVKAIFNDKKVIGFTKTVGIGNFTMDRGPVLTHPFEATGLEPSVKGYDYGQICEKLNLYPSFFEDKMEAVNKDEDMVTITVNGKQYKAEKGTLLLDACLQNGIMIPHLCHRSDLSPHGACRLCLVKVKGARGLVASCSTIVSDGMEVVTEDDELNHYRERILQLLLASHEHECLYCSKGNPSIAGSCELQNLVRKFAIRQPKYEVNKEKLTVDFTSPILKYDPNKCVLCGRCIRACDEIAGQHNLSFINRGSKTVVAAGANKNFSDSACVTCMACVFACPTGALTDKIIHYVGEDWEEVVINQA